VSVVSDVQRDVVVVDRVLDVPVPAGIAITEIGLADEFAIRDVDEIVGDRDAQLHLLDLVAPLVLVRPPDAGSLPLTRGVDPVPPFGVRPESNPTESALFARSA
jgi:hypothetical protein